MIALGLPDFGPVQNNISFNDAGGHHPRHPRRAVGQMGLGRDRSDLRRLGRPAGGCHLRRRLHDRARPVPGDLRAPRRRQLLPDPRAGHRVHVPGQRPLVARRDVLVPEPRRRDSRHRLADPARQTSRSRRRTSPTRAWPTSRPIPPRKTLVLGANGQLGRALRAELRRRPAHRVRHPRRPRPHRPGPGSAPAGGGTTTRSSTPPRTRRSTRAETPDGRARRLGRERHRRRRARPHRHRATASPSCTSPATTSSTGPSTAPTARTTRSARSASTGRPRRPATRRRHRPPPLHRPHLLGHRRGQELRPHHGLARRARHRPEGRRRPDRTPHLHHRHRRAASATCSPRARPTASTTSPAAGEPTIVGRHRPPRVRTDRPRPRTDHRRHHRRVLRHGDRTHRTPPPQQHPRPEPPHGGRLHAHPRAVTRSQSTSGAEAPR